MLITVMVITVVAVMSTSVEILPRVDVDGR